MSALPLLLLLAAAPDAGLSPPLSLQKPSAQQAAELFASSRIEASPTNDEFLVVKEPVTLMLAEGSGSDTTALKRLERILAPGTPAPAIGGWPYMLWSYVHAGPTGEPKTAARTVTIDGREVQALEFTVIGKGGPMYSGLFLTQLLPGARVRVVIGIREGDAKGWLGEVGPGAAFLLDAGAAWFVARARPLKLLGQALTIPPGCTLKPGSDLAVQGNLSCPSQASLTWVSPKSEPDLKALQQSLEASSKGTPCALKFKDFACTVGDGPGQCLRAGCEGMRGATTWAARRKLDERHTLVICTHPNRADGAAEPVCNGLFKPR